MMKFLTSILIIALSQSTLAQNEGRWYTVELLIFKRLGLTPDQIENWRSDIELDYPEFTYLIANEEGENSFKKLETENLKLSNYSRALRRKEDYQVLFHKSWNQQMQNKLESPAIAVSGGELIGNNRELSGYIKIYVARYLHLISNLWLITDNDPIELFQADDIEAYDDTAIEIWPRIPKSPVLVTKAISETTAPQKDKISLISAESSLFDDELVRLNNFNNYPVATLRTHRRMRSNELHYLDHPLMGILVFITSLEED